MAANYPATDKVKEINGKQFIADFRRCRLFVCISGHHFLPVLKVDVWRLARYEKLKYRIFKPETGRDYMIFE